MFRKLCLTGMLQFIQPGTGAQIFVGCVVASAAIGLQLYLKPYREPEANMLKTVVDAHIMLTFLVSFMLRVLSDDTVRSFEPLQANFYGWIIVLSMLLVGVAGVGLTGGQIYKHMRFQNDLVRTGSTESGFGMAAAEN
eukprot:COSAG03_NODE_1051_length_4947_cov_2.244224_4_plen_138_part_00